MSGIWDFEFTAGYLVPCLKGTNIDEIRNGVIGSDFSLNKELKNFLLDYFLDSPRYPIEINFTPSDDGGMKNIVRDLIIQICYGEEEEKIHCSRILSERLASVTDDRSPIGLFIIAVALNSNDKTKRIVLWKFPADVSLFADISDGKIKIEVLRDTFSSASSFFKAAMFEGSDYNNDFWVGRIEDRQSSDNVRSVSDFWVLNFLSSLPTTSNKYGSRVMGKAIKEILNEISDVRIQRKVVAAAITLLNRKSKISFADFSTDYLPSEASQYFIRNLPKGTDLLVTFAIDENVFRRQIGRRILSLTWEGSEIDVSGPVDTITDLVGIEPLDDQNQRVKIFGIIKKDNLKGL